MENGGDLPTPNAPILSSSGLPSAEAKIQQMNSVKRVTAYAHCSETSRGRAVVTTC